MEIGWVSKFVGTGGWKVANVLLGILVLIAIAAYGDIKSDISGVGSDIEEVRAEVKLTVKEIETKIDDLSKQLNDVDKKLAVRDQTISMILDDVDDMEKRLRALEAR